MDAVRCRRRAHVASTGAGFTLLELLVVVAIVGIMAAIATPQLVGAVAHARLRGAASSLAGVIQSSRMQAVKQNKTLSVMFTRRSDVPFAVIRDARDPDAEPARTDVEVQLGTASFKVAAPGGGGASAVGHAMLGFVPLTSPDVVSVSPRGLPCKYALGACPTSGFIFYLTDISRRDAWAAVSVSPGGRVKQWYWDGRSWTD